MKSLLDNRLLLWLILMCVATDGAPSAHQIATAFAALAVFIDFAWTDIVPRLSRLIKDLRRRDASWIEPR